jgi:hypothetical protein
LRERLIAITNEMVQRAISRLQTNTKEIARKVQ